MIVNYYADSNLPVAIPVWASRIRFFSSNCGKLLMADVNLAVLSFSISGPSSVIFSEDKSSPWTHTTYYVTLVTRISTPTKSYHFALKTFHFFFSFLVIFQFSLDRLGSCRKRCSTVACPEKISPLIQIIWFGLTASGNRTVGIDVC